MTDRAVRFAKQMRTDATDAERLLWRHLRAHRFGHHKFKRQQPIGPYIVDFVCFSSRVIVEVDGGQHLESARDAARDEWLRAQRFTVLRFWNNEVMQQSEAVVEKIALHVPLSPVPSPARGEGSQTEALP